ncbi:MAG: hypothetical protein PHV34_12550 [Verrucomicrobiae bacterium]|nr:hypothetical protein [Verrucomicrobiae bacterium]
MPIELEEELVEGTRKSMNVIQANCRVQFTPADIDFILSALDPGRRIPDGILKLLADPETRDLLLDDRHLYDAVVDGLDCLRISNHFYFYILVRHVLRRNGVDDRRMADYVAELLAQFSSTDRDRHPVASDPRPMDYLVDMLSEIPHADEHTRFLLRAHVGNHSLFLSGLFLGHIQFRTQIKAAPSVEYYESLGSANFKVASCHPLAEKYNLVNVFLSLAECFHSIRLALNKLADELLFLEPGFALQSLPARVIKEA